MTRSPSSPISTGPQGCRDGAPASIDSSMGQVLPIASADRVSAAWERYRSLVEQQRDDQRLLTNMPHQQAIARAWAAWRRLYLMTEHAG